MKSFALRALPSDASYVDHVTLVVEYLLQDVARLVPHPAHDLALIVYVLLLYRQVVEVAYEILAYHLAVLVEGGLKDVARLVHCALHGLTQLIRRLTQNGGGVRSNPLCCFGSTLYRFSGLLSRLSDSFANFLYRLSSAFSDLLGSLACSLACFLGCLARAFADLSNGLSGFSAKLADCLTYALASFLHGLTGTLAYLLGALPDPLADFLSSLAGALAYLSDRMACACPYVLHRRTGTFADALYRLARTLYGRARSRAYVLDSLACTFDRRASTCSYILYG